MPKEGREQEIVGLTRLLDDIYKSMGRKKEREKERKKERKKEGRKEGKRRIPLFCCVTFTYTVSQTNLRWGALTNKSVLKNKIGINVMLFST
jgi:hypothetical protein